MIGNLDCLTVTGSVSLTLTCFCILILTNHKILWIAPREYLCERPFRSRGYTWWEEGETSASCSKSAIVDNFKTLTTNLKNYFEHFTSVDHWVIMAQTNLVCMVTGEGTIYKPRDYLQGWGGGGWGRWLYTEVVHMDCQGGEYAWGGTIYREDYIHWILQYVNPHDICFLALTNSLPVIVLVRVTCE